MLKQSEKIKKYISFFTVDGKEKNFCDIIIENKKDGNDCIVTTFGISSKQIEKLLINFDKLMVCVDHGQSKLNPDMWGRLISLFEQVDRFTLLCSRMHAKIAVVDNEKLIITSANLTNNHKIESYAICKIFQCDGILQFLNFIKNIDINSVYFDSKSHDKKTTNDNSPNIQDPFLINF